MDGKVVIDEIDGTPGVNAISVMNKDGTVAVSKGFLENDNTLIAFTGSTVNDAAHLFTLGNAKHSLITGPGYKILVVINRDHYIGVSMDPDTDEHSIEQKINALIPV